MKISIQEKRPLVFIIIDIIVFSIYSILVLNKYSNSILTLPDELKFWGTSILVLVPILIVSRILLYLVFSISNTVITKKKEEKFLTDELGSIIKLKASRNFGNTFMMSFLLIMILLVFGMSIATMFKLFILSLFMSLTAYNITEIYYYKTGI